MWPDRVSTPGPLTYESGVLPIALRGPAHLGVEVGHTVVDITFVKVNIDREGPSNNNNSQPLIKSQRLLHLHLALTKRQTIV